jgi:hypothetical protein
MAQVVQILSSNPRSNWVSVAHACNPNYSGGRDQEDCGSKPAWANSVTLSQKTPTHKRAGRVAQKAEHLSSKHKALNTNPNSTKKKRSIEIMIY